MRPALSKVNQELGQLAWCAQLAPSTNTVSLLAALLRAWPVQQEQRLEALSANRRATFAHLQLTIGQDLAPWLRALPPALLAQRLQQTEPRVSAQTQPHRLTYPRTRASADLDSQTAEQEPARLVLLERLASALELSRAQTVLVKRTHLLLAAPLV